MEIFSFLIISYLLKYIKNITIYQCSRYGGMPDQCLNKWIDVYGNTRMDLWQCPTNKYCQILSTKVDNDSIGVCTFYYRKLYDGDSCSYHSECSSFSCEGGKCQGLLEGEFCHQGNFQCKNNLACRKQEVFYPYGELKEVYRCSNLSNIDEFCENDNECNVNLVCANRLITDIVNELNITYNISNITELKEKINFTEYILDKNSINKTCVRRASLENGLPTTNPMACKSGDTISIEIFPNYTENICASKKEIIKNCNEDNICIIKVNLGKLGEIEIEQNCIETVRGNNLCPLEQKEVAWNNYLSTYEYYYKSLGIEKNADTAIHLPAYKNTFNIFELSQSFWYYSEWQYSIEADSCTKEYFFLRNKGDLQNFSFLYILIQYLLLFI